MSFKTQKVKRGILEAKIGERSVRTLDSITEKVNLK